MMSVFSDHLPIVHGAFAEPIVYTGAGLSGAGITGIFADVPADSFTGPGQSARHCSFELRKIDLPQRPANGDTLVHDGLDWTVIDVIDRRDVAAWVVTVETAS